MISFTKIKEVLLNDKVNNVEKHKLLKESFEASSVDILYLNKEENIFRDSVTDITIATKYLKEDTLIGRVFNEKKGMFFKDIKSNDKYNFALDNPFKIDINSQIIIPLLKDNIVTVLFRVSGLPSYFTQIHFKRILDLLLPTFNEVFLKNESSSNAKINHIVAQEDRVKMYSTIRDIKHKFDELSNSTTDQEVKKLILKGKENLDNIFNYLNPSLQHVTRVKKELQSLKEKENRNHLNVLIADDVQINVKILNALLSNDNCIKNIYVAYDGIETKELLDKCEYEDEEEIHILFLDHHMPGILGSQIAKDLKEDGKDIVIVSITNDTAILEKHNHLYDYSIPKLFTKNNLKNIMENIKNEKL